MSIILSALICIICLSTFYYYGVFDYILESRPREPCDDQEEGNSVNLNNLIHLIGDYILQHLKV
jgi:hypothetical protein